MTDTLGIERHHIAGEPIPDMTPADWSRPIQVVDTTTGKRMAARVSGPDDGFYHVAVDEAHAFSFNGKTWPAGEKWYFDANGRALDSILRVVPAKPDANAEPAVHSIGGIGALEPLWDDERAPRLPTEAEAMRELWPSSGTIVTVGEVVGWLRDRNMLVPKSANPIRDFAEQHKHLSGEALLRAWEDAR